MIIQCVKCNARFDDEFRTTICPHETFAANDGKNNFSHHPEALLEIETKITPHAYSPDHQAMGDCQVCGHGRDKPWHP